MVAAATQPVIVTPQLHSVEGGNVITGVQAGIEQEEEREACPKNVKQSSNMTSTLVTLSPVILLGKIVPRPQVQ